MISTLIIGIIISAAGFWLTPAMLTLMRTPEDTYPEALAYLRIYFAGAVGLVLYNICTAVLRAVGDSTRPLFVLIFCAFTNIVLDILFVVVFSMGVSGAALATVISQLLSASVLVYILTRTDGPYHQFNLKGPFICRKIFLQMLNIGLPFGLQKTIVALSNTVVVSYVNLFGSGAMAGWSIYRRVDQVILQTMQSMSLAVTTFVSQNVGAGRYDRIGKGVRASFVITFSEVAVLTSASVLFRTQLILFFNRDPEVLKYGGLIISSLLPFQFFNGISQIRAGELRGRGKSVAATSIYLLSYVLFRQIYLYFGWPEFQSIRFVVMVYPVSWAISAVLMSVCASTTFPQK